jgi:hypothetical protein
MVVIGGGDTSWGAEDFHYLLHLASLEGHRLFVVHFDFFAFEYWFQCQEFRKDTSESPHISRQPMHKGLLPIAGV